MPNTACLVRDASAGPCCGHLLPCTCTDIDRQLTSFRHGLLSSLHDLHLDRQPDVLTVIDAWEPICQILLQAALCQAFMLRCHEGQPQLPGSHRHQRARSNATPNASTHLATAQVLQGEQNITSRLSSNRVPLPIVDLSPVVREPVCSVLEELEPWSRTFLGNGHVLGEPGQLPAKITPAGAREP
jgi:hypothetical protein